MVVFPGTKSARSEAVERSCKSPRGSWAKKARVMVGEIKFRKQISLVSFFTIPASTLLDFLPLHIPSLQVNTVNGHLDNGTPFHYLHAPSVKCDHISCRQRSSQDMHQQTLPDLPAITTSIPLRSRSTTAKMSSQDLQTILRQLQQNISQNSHQNSTTLLTRAKIAMLHQNALVPNSQTPQPLLQAAQQVMETGALISIRLQDPAAFTRYFLQLQPFYTLPTSSGKHSQRSKVTGLYLLLLLSQGDYAGFHTLLESLEVAANQAQEEGKGKGLEEDEFVQYPIRLEQWLMEGSYDRVWDETKSERVPSEEFAIFSDVS